MKPNAKHEKPKNFGASLKKLFKFCRKYYSLIIISLLLSVCGSILSVVGPNKLSDFVNHITNNMFSGIDLKFIAQIGLTLVAIYLISFVCSLIQGLIMANVSQKTAKNLRKEVSSKLFRLPLKYIDSNAYGDIMSKATNDVDTISQGLNNSISSLIGGITLLIATLVMMFVTNWILALTSIGATIIGFVLITLIMAKSQKYFFAQQNSLGEVNAHIEETFSAHDIIKVYNSDEIKKREFDKINENLNKNAYKSQFLSGLMPSLMSFIGNLGYVAVCVVGAILVNNNLTSIGTIIAFIIYVRLFSNPLTQISQAFSNLQSTVAASERVFELLEEQETTENENLTELNLNNIKGNVEFKNVNFGYDENLVIKNFSAKFKSGQKIAIVGPTGSGKTTLVNLLMRFYEINDGEILIDNINIQNLSKSTLHNIFGMVLQDTWLFEGTIRENLIFNGQNLSDDELDKICEVCGLTHFINTLPQKYDTILDDNTSVSVGQKQLLTIARAMVQNPPMLILDEATSSIDTRTEQSLQQAMDNLTKGRTSFVIAHRLSTIKNADQIVVMKNGEIVELGTHDELLSKNGFYADLYNSQFEKSDAE